MSASRRWAAAVLLQPRSVAACEVPAEPRAPAGRADAQALARVGPARRRLAAWALALLVTAIVPIGAAGQLPGRRVGSLVVSAGVLRTGQADEAISPLHFVGTGVEATVEAHRAHGPVDLLASLQAGAASLAPSDGSGSSERLQRGAIRLAALRSLAGETGLAAGVELRTFFVVTEHSVQPHPIPAAFLLGGVSVGPVVRQRLEAPGGTLQLDVGASLLSAMDHPYGSLGSGRSVLALRPATIASSRLGWGGISYSSGEGRRLGLEAAYRLELVDYADLQHVRHVTSGLTVGLRVRPRGMART